MTPLIFILIVSLILALLVYWVISTLNYENKLNEHHNLRYETASELSYGFAVRNGLSPRENELKLIRLDEMQLLAGWNISQEKWEEKAKAVDHGVHESNITLRVYYTSNSVKSFDIPVKSLRGSHELFYRSGTSYYVALGILNGSAFIPVIFSNTIMIPPKTKPTIQ